MKDEYTYGKQMARIGHTKVIFKGTFISNQSLFESFLELCVLIEGNVQNQALEFFETLMQLFLVSCQN